MPAREEKSLNQPIKKLGIIAGAGEIPSQLKHACEAQGIDCFVIGLKGNTDNIEPNYWSRIGKAGQIIERLRKENIRDIVMIGAVKRPNIFSLWPDWLTFKFFLRSWIRSWGDNTLLQAARAQIEEMGFTVHGVHEFLPDMLMPEGILGVHHPNDGQKQDISLGAEEALKLGQADIGQAILVKNGHVVAREDHRGTSWMIKKFGQRDAILVKMCKPQQDQDLDLPTIGPETVALCASKNMAGIVGHTGKSLLVDQQQVIELADKEGLFMMGVNPE